MSDFGQKALKGGGYGLNRNRRLMAAFDSEIAAWMTEVRQATYKAMPKMRVTVDKRLKMLKDALLHEVQIYDLQPKNNRGMLLENARKPMEVEDAVVMVLRHPKRLSDRLIRQFFVLWDDNGPLNVHGDLLMKQEPMWDWTSGDNR